MLLFAPQGTVRPMFVNSMPRYEILSADAVAVLDRGWRRIVSEIGIQFAKPEAAGLFARAGQRSMPAEHRVLLSGDRTVVFH